MDAACAPEGDGAEGADGLAGRVAGTSGVRVWWHVRPSCILWLATDDGGGTPGGAVCPPDARRLAVSTDALDAWLAGPDGTCPVREVGAYTFAEVRALADAWNAFWLDVSGDGRAADRRHYPV